MSVKAGFFIDGATAKLVVNGLPLAYATDVSYRIMVKHASPRVLGMYETTEFPALYYEVSGAFTLIRYAREWKDHHTGKSGSVLVPKGVSNRGNSIGQWQQDVGSSLENVLANTLGSPFGSSAAEGRAHQSFVPAALNKGMHFDIEIRQRVQSFKESDEFAFARFRNCRITDAEFTLTKRGVAQQRFAFVARYVDEDGFTADKSGVGQDLE